MEWLMIIAFIVVSILDSKKKSEQAKQQREQRQKAQGQQVYRSEKTAAPKTTVQKTASQQRKPQQQTTGSPLGDFLKELENWAESLDAEEHPAKPAKEKTVVVQASPKKPGAVPKSRKAAPQTEKKSPAALPTKTLMEMRPDREKREEHTKVTANVKPLKNAFENQENCEHRIELNPNIQYSKQNQAKEQKASIEVKTDSEALIQGIIWSEILGKPKAYQPTQPKFQRRQYSKYANE